MFNSIKYYNFRNIKNCEIKFKKNNFLIGNNGQGKTNILESIYILSYGNSFKKSSEQILTTYEKKETSLIGKIDNNEIKYLIKNRKKEILLNDKKIKDRKDIININSVIIFYHEDINIINGEPELKRKFMDQLICMVFPKYLIFLREYKKILKQRNIALKNNNSKLVEIYNIQISNYAYEIIKCRNFVIKEINEIYNEIFKNITSINEDIKIIYKNSFNSIKKEEILKILKKNTQNDFRLKTTTKGPHRDNFIFFMNNKDFGKVASTGQKRVMSLILKIVQAKYLLKKNIEPIILLDDVILELDEEKRKKFMKEIPKYKQAFFTFLPNEKYQNYTKDDLKIFDVEKGELNERSF